MSRMLMTMIRPLSYGASRMAMYYALALKKAGHEVVVFYSERIKTGETRRVTASAGRRG